MYCGDRPASICKLRAHSVWIGRDGGWDTGTEITLDIGAIFGKICITNFYIFAKDGAGKNFVNSALYGVCN